MRELRRNHSIELNSIGGAKVAQGIDSMAASVSVTSPAASDRSESSSAEAAPKRVRRSWSRFFLDVLSYVAIFVVISGISIGPLFWVWFGAVFVDGPKWIARVYQPLIILCDVIPPLGRLVNAWINWWIL